MVQCAGLAANYVIYAAVIMAFHTPKAWLVAPLALGAVAGLCVTFLGAKHLAFRPTPRLSSAEPGPVADTSPL